MKNLRFELEKTYKSTKAENEAKLLKQQKKLVPLDLLSPSKTGVYLTTKFEGKIIRVYTGIRIQPKHFDSKKNFFTNSTKKSNESILLSNIYTDCLLKYIYMLGEKRPIYKVILNAVIIEEIILSAIEKVIGNSSTKTK